MDTSSAPPSWSLAASARANELVAQTRRVVGTLVARLRAERLTLATAESLTAGMASYVTIDEPGAGEVVLGGIVAYSVAAKRAILGVSHDCDVVSAACASQMAIGAQRLFGTACAIALTGVAGPQPLDQHPVGQVLIAVRCGGIDAVAEHRFVGDPDEVRLQSIAAAAGHLESLLDAVGQPGSFGSGGSATSAPSPAT